MAIVEQLLGVFFNGLNTGAVLLIAALGLAIVFGLMGVINLAHGELMMLGAYTTYVVQNGFKTYAEPLLDLYIFAALPLAFIVAALVGLLLERTVVRFLYGRPLETLLATWGVSLILIQFVRSVNTVMVIGLVLFAALFLGGRWVLQRFASWERIADVATAMLVALSGAIAITLGITMNRNESDFLTKLWFGPRNIDVTAPKWLRGGFSVPETTLQFPAARIFIIVLTILCLIAMYWFLNRSAWGLRIRAVTQNRDMSACLGIPTSTVDALTFALGSGLAGIAGCAITLLGSVGPNLGGAYIVDAFMVVVVGGVGNFAGSILAAIAIGTVSYLIGSGTIPLMLAGAGEGAAYDFVMAFFNFFAQSSMAKVMVFALIITFLQIRPGGLFPQKGRTAEL